MGKVGNLGEGEKSTLPVMRSSVSVAIRERVDIWQLQHSDPELQICGNS